MHPQLSEKKLVCREFIKALEECHASGWSRFIGTCNKHKEELNNCLRAERSKKAAANREDSKARKARAEQASKAFYEE